MKLTLINDDIFEPHKSLVEKRESSFIYIYIYIYIIVETKKMYHKKCYRYIHLHNNTNRSDTNVMD